MQTIFDGVANVPQILADADAFMADHPVVSAIIGVIAVALLALGYLAARAALRAGKRVPAFLASRIAPRPVEDTLTVIAAGIATVVSASGMWQFFERIMPGVDWPWRLIMFAFIEVAVITSAVRAKRSMRDKYSAGVDGIAVWTLTSLSAVLSAMEAASLPEALFRLAAPLVAAWLWERGMAIERHRLTGLAGIHWRITPERILVRLGLAEAKNRTADEVDAHRRLTRVALAAKRVHQLRQANASDRKLRAAITRRDRALDQAVEHTDLARNKATQATLLDIATTLGGGDSITALLETAAAPWADLDHPAMTGAARNSDALVLADALDEWTAAIEREHDPEVSAAVTSMAAYISGRHLPHGSSATSSPVADEVAQQVALARLGAPWTGVENGPAATRGATPAATRTATSEQVALEVAGEVTDDDMEAIIAALRRDDSDTDDDTETATASATEAMWRYWEQSIAEERLPTGAELGRAGGCRESYGRRKRAEWLEEMDGRTRRRLLGLAAKRVTA